MKAKHKKLLWNILLTQQKFENFQYSKVWMLASGALNVMQMKHNKHYYTNLRDHHFQYPNLCFHQVNLDLRRTFPNEDPKDVEKYMEPLRNVLQTFLKRTPTIGYCQGMNFYAGTFLRYMSEEEAFWLFVCINENILPLDYYSDMLGILVDQRVFELLMVEKFPKLVAHMKKHTYQLDLISFQWLVTLFCSSLKHESELFVLTAFILKGCKIIIKIALLIIEYLQERVLAAGQFDQIYTIISKDPMNEITPKVLCKLLKENKKNKHIKLTNTMLKELRDKVRPEIIETLQTLELTLTKSIEKQSRSDSEPVSYPILQTHQSNDQAQSLFHGKMQMAALQALIQTAAEKVDYEGDGYRPR